MRGNIFTSPVFDPMGVRLLIITNENTKQDDHSNLPDKADYWETDSNIGVFGHFKSCRFSRREVLEMTVKFLSIETCDSPVVIKVL